MACGKVKVLFLVLLTVAILFVNAGKCEDEVKADENGVENGEGRTFGHHFLKRMSFAVIPIIYKMGMMTTLLVTLTIMSTKGLAIGILLLILGISQILSRATLNPPIAAPFPVSYSAPVHHQPAAYPLVYSHAHAHIKPDWPGVIPVVQKAVVHSAPHYAQPYSSGWQSKSGYNPYAREDTEEDPEYVKKN